MADKAERGRSIQFNPEENFINLPKCEDCEAGTYVVIFVQVCSW